MTPGNVSILVEDPEGPQGDPFVAARVWIRSGAMSSDTGAWLVKAIAKAKGPDPYRLATVLLETGGDLWLTVSPGKGGNLPEWTITRDNIGDRWIIGAPAQYQHPALPVADQERFTRIYEGYEPGLGPEGRNSACGETFLAVEAVAPWLILNPTGPDYYAQRIEIAAFWRTFPSVDRDLNMREGDHGALCVNDAGTHYVPGD